MLTNLKSVKPVDALLSHKAMWGCQIWKAKLWQRIVRQVAIFKCTVCDTKKVSYAWMVHLGTFFLWLLWGQRTHGSRPTWLDLDAATCSDIKGGSVKINNRVISSARGEHLPRMHLSFPSFIWGGRSISGWLPGYQNSCETNQCLEVTLYIRHHNWLLWWDFKIFNTNIVNAII